MNEINGLTRNSRMLNVTYDNKDITKDMSVNEILNQTVAKGNVISNLSTDSHPSNVGTLERINDLNLVTSRLSELKSARKATPK